MKRKQATLSKKEFEREIAWKKLKAFADTNIDLGIGKFDRKNLYKGKRFGGQ